MGYGNDYCILGPFRGPVLQHGSRRTDDDAHRDPWAAGLGDSLRAPGSQCGRRQSRQFANLSEEALSFSTQQILLDLAAAGQRELVDEEDAARELEAGDAAAAEVEEKGDVSGSIPIDDFFS